MFLELQPLLPPIKHFYLAATLPFFSHDHYSSVNVFLQIKKKKIKKKCNLSKRSLNKCSCHWFVGAVAEA